MLKTLISQQCNNKKLKYLTKKKKLNLKEMMLKTLISQQCNNKKLKYLTKKKKLK